MLDNAIATMRNVIATAYLAWIGFLLYYFSGFASNPIMSRSLGPTITGLAAVFTVGATFMLLKLVRAGTRERARREMKALDGRSQFDAEGAIERYMASRGSAERAPIFDDSALHGDAPTPAPVAAPVAAPPPPFGQPAPRGFGRRGQ